MTSEHGLKKIYMLAKPFHNSLVIDIAFFSAKFEIEVNDVTVTTTTFEIWRLLHRV